MPSCLHYMMLAQDHPSHYNIQNLYFQQRVRLALLVDYIKLAPCILNSLAETFSNESNDKHII